MDSYATEAMAGVHSARMQSEKVLTSQKQKIEQESRNSYSSICFKWISIEGILQTLLRILWYCWIYNGRPSTKPNAHTYEIAKNKN